MAAHSAVLADIPYFWALLNKDWQGSNWNFNNKLRLSLPFDVTKEGLEILLEFLYVGNNCFVRRGPLDSVLMQASIYFCIKLFIHAGRRQSQT